MSQQSTRAVLTRLLENLGPQREVQHYLQHYGHASGAVAVVRVQGALLDEREEALVSSLAFLREVGLLPVVVVGAGTQLTQALQQAGVDDPKSRGDDAVTPAIVDVARRVYAQQNQRLVQALEELGVRARGLGSNLLAVAPKQPTAPASKGEILDVDDSLLQWPLKQGEIPVVSPLGETREGQVLHLSADHVAHHLTLKLQPKKLVFLTVEGGITDGAGHVLDAINLAEDKERLAGDDALHVESRRRVQRLESLLQQLGPQASVSVTSPEQLPRELFTHRGAGTLVRMGERIERFTSFADVDQGMLRGLLEDVFGRALLPTYFDDKDPFRVYVASNAQATAILTQGAVGEVPYLDKFAVTAKAQGAGVGGALWRRVRRENPKMYWRARCDNSINSWYFKNADGTYRDGDWVVFWVGLDGFDDAKACVQHALSLPASLKAHGRGEAS